MTRTQTALAHWPLTDPEWWLIDPAEWQEGQVWRVSPTKSGTWIDRDTPPHGPAWVRELLPIPDPPAEWPYDKLAWLGDVPVALAGDLPPTTKCTTYDFNECDPASAWGPKDLVVVVEWPDGTKPVKPTRRFTAVQTDDLDARVVEVGHSGGALLFASPADADEFVAQVNGDQA